MKKIIQFCAIISLVVVFSAAPGYAEAVSSLEAKIPFDFKIGAKSYSAGTYVIKVARVTPAYSLLSIEDKEGHRLETIFAATSRDVAGEGPFLVFGSYDNHRFLSKIITGGSGFVIRSGNKKMNNFEIKGRNGSKIVGASDNHK